MVNPAFGNFTYNIGIIPEWTRVIYCRIVTKVIFSYGKLLFVLQQNPIKEANK